MLDTPTKFLENIVNNLSKEFEIHNIEYKKFNHNTPKEYYEVGLGGSSYLVKTATLTYHPIDNIIVFTTKIITDSDMYNDCKVLAQKYSSGDSLFLPTANFHSSLGSNSIVNVKIVLNDENMPDIKKILKLIEFKSI